MFFRRVFIFRLPNEEDASQDYVTPTVERRGYGQVRR
jgi:hypothetical protein